MPKKSIRSLAQDSRWIAGIYNYCDRWCERCRLSSRCLVYAQEQANGEPQTGEQLAQHVSECFQEAMTMLAEEAEKRGFDLSAAPDPTDVAREQATRQLVGQHPVVTLARDYERVARKWLAAHAPAAVGPAPEGPAVVEAQKARDAKMTRDEAIEIITRHLYFVRGKLTRALWGEDGDDMSPNATQSDANGSAKVALAAIDETVGAWLELMLYEGNGAEIMRLLLALTSLRDATRQAFPRAQAFVRPGFDTGDEPLPDYAARSPRPFTPA